MTSPEFHFCLTYLFLCKVALVTNQTSASPNHPESTFAAVNIGENITLHCFHEHVAATKIYWYKQSLGQVPRLISTLTLLSKNATFHDEFKNNSRFTLDSVGGRNNLMIKNLQISDSAYYYCARRLSYTIEFLKRTVVSVKGSDLNIPALVYQPESETIQPGGSVTLNCTVQTGTCDGEHSVYWFKNSQDSHPGVIYTHGDRNNQCERIPETQTHSCVYNLPMKNLTGSHAGTYYCAVASCGHILFGNGTKLHFDGNCCLLVYVLCGALTFTTTLVVVLTFLLYKRNSCQPRESDERFSVPSTTNIEQGCQDDNLHYAALRNFFSTGSRRQRYTNSESVYSNVKL